MQNEWAGAQAFSSFDTYLAPFVRADHLNYKQVKQCIQSFVFGVNTPSRWGCVPMTTKIATPNGWKSYDELKLGDIIYTWVDGTLHEAPLKHLIHHNNDYGVLHRYKGVSYQQTVTPEHRCIIESGIRNKFIIRQSMDVFNKRKDTRMPTCISDVDVTSTTNLSDDEVVLAAMLYTDGTSNQDDISIYKSILRDNGLIEQTLKQLGLDYSCYDKTENHGNPYRQYRIASKHKDYIISLIGKKSTIDEKFLHMDNYQSKLFITTWASFDGSIKDRIMCQYDNDAIRESLEIIMLRAGYVSHQWSRKKDGDKNPTNYLYADTKNTVVISETEEIAYDGPVWCPNTDDGTAIYKDEDSFIFISGNCQAPFTNITLDWVCPDDMKNMPAIVGGKEQDFTYGDCTEEMAMVNKAFIEIMIEGDANGRGFQYPIPTYSITKDFDWSPSENNKLLFEMTAKYGTPYFSNYINSDMEPSDVRAMCPLRGDQKVLVMDDYSKEFHVSTIENLYGGNKKDKVYTILLNGETKLARLHRFDGLDFYKVRTVNGHEVIFSGNHQNLALKKGSTEDAKVKPTTELTTSDYLPFSIEPFDGGKGLSYDDGYLVGAFMGDGSLRDDYAVVYSLNDTTKNEVMSKIIDIGVDRYGAKVTTTNANKTGTCINVTLISKSLRGLIEDYVTGKAINKALNPKCINRSLEFRKGILDGLLATDGNIKSNRIYTSSKPAVETITTMLASMGIPTNVRSDNRDSTETMSDNPIYCIRAYRPATCQPSYGDVYVRQDGYMWFRIESIEPVTGGSAIGYCFEVLNDEEPYFMLPSGLVTHNCRLRLDLRELRKKSGGYFGAGESTGSVGVVTLNLPRLAYLSANEAEFYQRLSRLMDIAARSLNIKRRVITKLMDEGLYPYTKAYLGSFDNHFSTIGLVGMNEACLNAKWIHTTIAEPAGHQFAEEVLDFMRNRLSDYQEQYQGTLFNLEATPAESTAYRLAKHDIAKYPDIITAAAPGQTAYYTNSSQLPVGYTDDIFDALDLQDNLQTRYTSGTVFHAFLGERLPNWQAAANLVRKIAENYKLPYYTLSPTYAICAEHGYLPGEQYKCPFCGKETEVYSRITGYYRPLKNWNDGKVQEFKNRLEYDQHKAGVPDTEPTPCEAMCASCQVEIPADSSEQVPESVAAEMPILVATETCPNCRMAARFLDDAGIAFTKVYASQRPDLVETYGIRTAPTLLVPDHGQMKAIINASNIRAYAEANRNP